MTKTDPVVENLQVRLRRPDEAKEEVVLNVPAIGTTTTTHHPFDLMLLTSTKAARTTTPINTTILHQHGIYTIQPDRCCTTKTPSVSPVKARRLNSMNGDYATCTCTCTCTFATTRGGGATRDRSTSLSSSSLSSLQLLPPNLVEILSPSSSESSSSSSSTSSSLSASNVLDDLICDHSNNISPSSRQSFPGQREVASQSSWYLSIIQTTIHEEAVEMTLNPAAREVDQSEMVVASAYNHCRIMGGDDDVADDDDDDDDADDNNNDNDADETSGHNHHDDGDNNQEDNNHYSNICLDSSIVVLPSNDYDEYQTTPGKVEYCGIVWPCCHAATPFLVDDGLHSKICTSLAMEHWTCWQITYHASPTAAAMGPPSPLGVQRSYRRGHKNLDSLRRMLLPLEPKKTQSFCPAYPTRRNQSFGSCESGYESDPEVHLAIYKTDGNAPLSATPTTSTLRATTIDEFFNERLRLVVHEICRSRVVRFWLERGMARFAIPPQICWHDGIRRTAIPILDITKVLSGVAGTDQSHLSIPASAQRCFRICISDGTTYTLETSSVPMQRDLTALLKTTVATLAAAVLTHGNVDEFFVRKEAWI